MIQNYDSLEDIKQMNKESLQQALEYACLTHDTETAKYILNIKKIKCQIKTGSKFTKFLYNAKNAIINMMAKLNIEPIIDIDDNNGNALKSASYSGNIELIKYLLFSPEIKKHADVLIDNSKCFFEAAKMGHLEVVRLLHKEIKKKNGPKDNKLYIDSIAMASANGYLNTIEYILSERPEDRKELVMQGFAYIEWDNIELFKYYLTYHCDIIDINNNEETRERILKRACYNKSMHLLEYLTTDKDLKNKLIIDPNDDDFIIRLLEDNARKAAKYLIFNHNIKKTDKLIKWMQYDGPEIFDVFEKRDLNNKLHESLQEKHTEVKRRKL